MVEWKQISPTHILSGKCTFIVMKQWLALVVASGGDDVVVVVMCGRDCGVLIVTGRGCDCGRCGRRDLCDRYRMCILVRM